MCTHRIAALIPVGVIQGIEFTMKRIIIITLVAVLLASCTVNSPLAGENEPSPLPSPGRVVPAIFVEGELFVFFRSNYGSTREKAAQLNADELEYIGDVVGISYDEEGNYISFPTEEFYSSGFAVGTKIYRINEDLIYIEGEMPYTGHTYDVFWSDIGSNDDGTKSRTFTAESVG